MRKVTVKLEAGPNGAPPRKARPQMSEEVIKKAARLFSQGKVSHRHSTWYHVRGNTETYVVHQHGEDPKDLESWACNCPAGMQDEPRPCSHIGACMLYVELHGQA